MAASERVRAALLEAGYRLPDSPAALGSYVPAVRSDGFVFTSGQLPMREGTLVSTGIVGADVDEATAVDCATQCALNALAAAMTVCDLDTVARVVKVTGYVASVPTFTGQPGVINGASAVMLAAFGEVGKHARAAVGVSALPLGAPVEIEIVLALS